MTEFAIQRIYEPSIHPDDYRVLVDRLWPRGIRTSEAALDEWCKDLAPSTELRTWWNHDPGAMEEFSNRYREELDQNATVADICARLTEHSHVTLLYAARDENVNHAVVLRDYLAKFTA
jgi:uncharacterized protein YeaO (DUF488 family)